jgi:NIPSNAP
MTMPGSHAKLQVYIHETTHVRAGSTDRFVEKFTDHYQPAMEKQGARLFGIWESSALNGSWPEITTIWEIDSYQHFSRLAAGRHRDPETRKIFQQWMGLLGDMDGKGEGRLVYGSPGMKTVEQRKTEGFKTTVLIQEIMQTKPGRQRDYIEQLEYAYVPWSERTGKKWLGSFTTVFRCDEVIHYWACEGGWDVFANHYPSWGDKPDADIKSWMQLAPALRQSWDDTFLQSLPPNPLG